ncbi:hypothetical protein [Burkholderia pseudomallei]|nr:hypothetical protein [Burkholderia pseudomallei]
MASVGFWLLASKLAWLDAGAVASLAVVREIDHFSLLDRFLGMIAR